MNRCGGRGDGGGGGGASREVTTTRADHHRAARARPHRQPSSSLPSASRSDRRQRRPRLRLQLRLRRRESFDIPSLPLLVVVTFALLATTTTGFVRIPAGSPTTTGTKCRLRGIDDRIRSRSLNVAAECGKRAALSLRIGHDVEDVVSTLLGWSSVLPSPPRLSRSLSHASSWSSSSSRSSSRSACSTRLALSTSPSAAAALGSGTSFLPLIKPTDDWGNVAVLSAAASAAHVLGRRTAIGRLLGPPVSAMAIAFVAGSVGILPPGGSAGCKLLQSLSLQLATPLLLLGADLRGCGERAGPLLMAFILASVGTVLASCVAVTVFGPTLSRSMPNPGDGIKIAAALMAKNVGGGINYVAVCRSLDASSVAVAAGLCVDNIFALVYFPATSALASGLPDVEEEEDVSSDGGDVGGGVVDPGDETGGAFGSRSQTKADVGSKEGGGKERRYYDEGGEDAGSSSPSAPLCETTSASDAATTTTSSTTTTPIALTVGDVSTTLSLSLLSTWMGERVGGAHNAALPTSTLFTVLLASLAPERWIRPLRPAGEILGTALLYLFFATAGAPGMAVADSVRRAFVPLGGFLIILYGLHGAFLYASRRLFLKFTLGTGAVAPQRLLAASSAAIGGPATAAALVQANGWTSLLAPSLLVGNLGYAVATFAGLVFHALFRGSSS